MYANVDIVSVSFECPNCKRECCQDIEGIVNCDNSYHFEVTKCEFCGCDLSQFSDVSEYDEMEWNEESQEWVEVE